MQMPLVLEAVLPFGSNSTWPSGDPGMIWLSAHISHCGCSCAQTANGKIAHRNASAAMLGNFLIKPGQLNRTLPDSQASFQPRSRSRTREESISTTDGHG